MNWKLVSSMAYWRINLTADSDPSDDSVFCADDDVDAISAKRDCDSQDSVQESKEISFVKALRDKYCEESLTIVYFNSPRRRASSAELGFLQNVVLDNCEITHAGLPGNGLKMLCPNVVDLDLSKNNIIQWSEVLPIMFQLPFLKFVNLSFNKLKNHQGCLERIQEEFPAVENLVLNGTEVPWKDVTSLTRHMPKLKELHLCTNGYTGVEHNNLDDLLSALSSVQCLRLNNNNITRWEAVSKLGIMPALKTLILSGNPLQNVECQEYVSLGEDEHGHGVECNGINSNGDSGHDVDDRRVEKIAEEVQDFLDFVVTRVVKLNSVSDEEHWEAEQENSENLNTEEFSVAMPVRLNIEGGRETVRCDENRAETSMDDSVDGEICQESDEGAESRSEGGNSVKAFTALTTLCVSDTHLSDWSAFEEFTKFPKLNNLRIKGIKLHQDLTSEERRKLFLASLPHITVLNGSEVSPNEREKAETHFVRYFADKDKPPQRYHDLVKKYGKSESITCPNPCWKMTADQFSRSCSWNPSQ
ncbi:tubulin-specific chaperone cofactor E-like protein isoform X2 [Ptychodera flava]|uniref:tubulin-specific chaperone cofactor E-like protein isoform X2 n=1 Tax=Ptychodera flava TaxID=63121 RepID=UPI00396A4110